MEILISLKLMSKEGLIILEKEIKKMIIDEWGHEHLRLTHISEKDDLLAHLESV